MQTLRERWMKREIDGERWIERVGCRVWWREVDEESGMERTIELDGERLMEAAMESWTKRVRCRVQWREIERVGWRQRWMDRWAERGVMDVKCDGERWINDNKFLCCNVYCTFIIPWIYPTTRYKKISKLFCLQDSWSLLSQLTCVNFFLSQLTRSLGAQRVDY
jgi:hypothetical protein